MPKMREFKFNGGEEPKTVEAMSYKKAVKSYQNNHDIKKYHEILQQETFVSFFNFNNNCLARKPRYRA